MSSAVIVSFARTPIGRFRGSLSSLTAPQLGSVAIKGALARIDAGGGEGPVIAEAVMGNVVSAGIGQAPCRQAVLGSGLPQSTVCTTVNKVCASGMKAVGLSAQAVAAGSLPLNMAMIAGGMESMSNIPHYLPSARGGTSLGHGTVLDGIIHDGLWDVYNDQHMGMCAEKCASDYGISREVQDAYCVESYRRCVQGQSSSSVCGL